MLAPTPIHHHSTTRLSPLITTIRENFSAPPTPTTYPRQVLTPLVARGIVESRVAFYESLPRPSKKRPWVHLAGSGCSRQPEKRVRASRRASGNSLVSQDPVKLSPQCLTPTRPDVRLGHDSSRLAVGTSLEISSDSPTVADNSDEEPVPAAATFLPQRLETHPPISKPEVPLSSAAPGESSSDRESVLPATHAQAHQETQSTHQSPPCLPFHSPEKDIDRSTAHDDARYKQNHTLMEVDSESGAQVHEIRQQDGVHDEDSARNLEEHVHPMHTAVKSQAFQASIRQREAASALETALIEALAPLTFPPAARKLHKSRAELDCWELKRFLDEKACSERWRWVKEMDHVVQTEQEKERREMRELWEFVEIRRGIMPGAFL